MPTDLDIRTAVQVAIVLSVVGALINLIRGVRSIRGAQNTPFFRLRRDRIVRGWRLLFFAVFLVILSFFLNSYAEPIAYRYFPPSPSATLTATITPIPSITLTPTISLTPTITETPSETNTPTVTPTASIPIAIQSRFDSSVTPNPDAIFSALVFTQGIDDNYQPLDAGTEFQNPLGHMFALFSYDGMVDGAQWTALWYRDGELVHFETEPWDGGTGGLGFTDWNPDPSEWLPASYEVQIFVGLEWKVIGFFEVFGEAPTPSASRTPTVTLTLTPTPTSLATATRTRTPTPGPPTFTPFVPSPTWTRGPTATPETPTATLTRQPTATFFSPTP